MIVEKAEVGLNERILELSETKEYAENQVAKVQAHIMCCLIWNGVEACDGHQSQADCAGEEYSARDVTQGAHPGESTLRPFMLSV